MTIKNISDLPAGTPALADLIEFQQGGVNKQANLSSLINVPNTTPVLALTPPPQAAALGYNTLTFGPNVTLGSNWFLANFFGVTPIPGQAVQNADGSLSLGHDGSGFGAGVCTFNKGAGSAWNGKCFGGGYYIEFVAKFTPTLGSSALPFPALWALDLPTLNGQQTLWPGQGAGFFHRIELDFMQWPHDTLQYFQGVGLIDWFGKGVLNTPRIRGPGSVGTPTVVDSTGQFQNATGQVITAGNYVTIYGTAGGPGAISGYTSVPQGHPYLVSAVIDSTHFRLTETNGAVVNTTAGAMTGLWFAYVNVTAPAQIFGSPIHMGALANPFSFANYNRFGYAVVPATNTAFGATQGTVVNYLNNVQMNYAGSAPPNPVWDLYSSANAPPPVLGSSAGSIMDTLQMGMIMGTDTTCPMTIASVSVWQASDAGNITQ